MCLLSLYRVCCMWDLQYNFRRTNRYKYVQQSPAGIHRFYKPHKNCRNKSRNTCNSSSISTSLVEINHNDVFKFRVDITQLGDDIRVHTTCPSTHMYKQSYVVMTTYWICWVCVLWPATCSFQSLYLGTGSIDSWKTVDICWEMQMGHLYLPSHRQHCKKKQFM